MSTQIEQLKAVLGILAPGSLTILERGQALIDRIENEPAFRALLADARNLFKLPDGNVLTSEQIAGLRNDWITRSRSVTKDLPHVPPVDPPTPVGLPRMTALPTKPAPSELLQTDVLYTNDGGQWLIYDARPGTGNSPNEFWPEPGGWHLPR